MAKYTPNGAAMRAANRLRRLIGNQHGDQIKFARKYRVSQGHLNNVLNGRRPLGKRLTKVLDQLTAAAG